MFLHYVSITGLSLFAALIVQNGSDWWHVHLLELLNVFGYYPLKILFLTFNWSKNSLTLTAIFSQDFRLHLKQTSKLTWRKKLLFGGKVIFSWIKKRRVPSELLSFVFDSDTSSGFDFLAVCSRMRNKWVRYLLYCLVTNLLHNAKDMKSHPCYNRET